MAPVCPQTFSHAESYGCNPKSQSEAHINRQVREDQDDQDPIILPARMMRHFLLDFGILARLYSPFLQILLDRQNDARMKALS